MQVNNLDDVVDNYQVIDEQKIFLSVQVGNGQLGYHYIRLDLLQIGDGYYSHDFDDLSIGLGSEIKSKTLFITSNISNNMSLASAIITYTLIGGVSEPKIIRHEKAFDGKEAIAIKAKIKFI
jgi:hypothetical protein